ncbi:hypothetical protein BLNAU_15624 [Blattamonas nauphoetae]|uniref:Uncharacterized protein n=1 Tax=Blattamonas nauphoetae TaxID=2049346 RepID=A0ABQ9XDS0_9EUKA|nr:hypothetical protein BLNAU_15624 [Blattamonas nauphoetae]
MKRQWCSAITKNIFGLLILVLSLYPLTFLIKNVPHSTPHVVVFGSSPSLTHQNENSQLETEMSSILTGPRINDQAEFFAKSILRHTRDLATHDVNLHVSFISPVLGNKVEKPLLDELHKNGIDISHMINISPGEPEQSLQPQHFASRFSKAHSFGTEGNTVFKRWMLSYTHRKLFAGADLIVISGDTPHNTSRFLIAAADSYVKPVLYMATDSDVSRMNTDDYETDEAPTVIHVSERVLHFLAAPETFPSDSNTSTNADSSLFESVRSLLSRGTEIVVVSRSTGEMCIGARVYPPHITTTASPNKLLSRPLTQPLTDQQMILKCLASTNTSSNTNSPPRNGVSALVAELIGEGVLKLDKLASARLKHDAQMKYNTHKERQTMQHAANVQMREEAELKQKLRSLSSNTEAVQELEENAKARQAKEKARSERKRHAHFKHTSQVRREKHSQMKRQAAVKKRIDFQTAKRENAETLTRPSPHRASCLGHLTRTRLSQSYYTLRREDKERILASVLQREMDVVKEGLGTDQTAQ